MKKTDIIPLFFSAELSGAQWKSFVTQFHEDPEFRLAVLDAKVLYDGLDALKAEQLKKKLQEWKAELDILPEEQPETKEIPTGFDHKKAFQHSDTVFDEQMDDLKVVLQGLDALRHEALKEKLQSWKSDILTKDDNQPLEESLPIPIRWYQQKWLQAAASIILVLGLGLWWVLSDRGSQKQLPILAVIESTYIEPEFPDLDRGSVVDLIKAAQREFELENYEATLNILDAIPATDSLNTVILFTGMHAAYKNEQYQLVQDKYEELISAASKEGTTEVNFENANLIYYLAKLQTLAADGLTTTEKQSLAEELKTFLDQSNTDNTYHQKVSSLRNFLLE